MFFGKAVGYTDIPAVDTSNDKFVSCITQKLTTEAYLSSWAWPSPALAVVTTKSKGKNQNDNSKCKGFNLFSVILHF